MFYQLIAHTLKYGRGRTLLCVQDNGVEEKHVALNQTLGDSFVKNPLVEAEDHRLLMDVKRNWRKAGFPGEDGDTVAVLEDGELSVMFDGRNKTTVKSRTRKRNSVKTVNVAPTNAKDDRLDVLSQKIDRVSDALTSFIEASAPKRKRKTRKIVS